MTAINGHDLSGAEPAPDPRHHVAEAVYTVMMDEGDPPFSEIEGEDLADILHLTENYLTAHLNFLGANGFRIIPPGATPIPKSDAEAKAMTLAVKQYMAAQRRKGGLLSAGPRGGLILPKGGH